MLIQVETLINLSYLILYIDDLCVLLSQSGIGCHFEGLCINYADDLCLIAPCAIALQELLNMCLSYCRLTDRFVRLFNNFSKNCSYCYTWKFLHNVLLSLFLDTI